MDYQELSTVILFEPGVVEQRILVDVFDDNIAGEEEESFSIRLELVQSPVGVTFGQERATIFITDINSKNKYRHLNSENMAETFIAKCSI